MSAAAIVVGTAGWNIPGSVAERFDADGPQLERYARRFGGVEVNSSFHRPHKRATWQRWANIVPPDFRFSVKVPKAITHGRKLVDCADILDFFLEEVGGLGDKLAVLLVQLPPKLAFDPGLAESFFQMVTGRTAAKIVCEPRHPSWFDEAPDAMLTEFRVARVAADPATVAAAAQPGGWRGISYLRLHGSPAMYRSSYEPARLAGYSATLRDEQAAGRASWCMFDNTASSAATLNALDLLAIT